MIAERVRGSHVRPWFFQKLGNDNLLLIKTSPDKLILNCFHYVKFYINTLETEALD